MCYQLKRYPKATMRIEQHGRTLQRIKNGILLRNPETPAEIVDIFKNEKILESFGYTFGEGEKKNIFYDGTVETDSFSYCVLSSKYMISLINAHIRPEHIHILMDATFKTVPLGPFNQLLIIYIRKHQQVKYCHSF